MIVLNGCNAILFYLSYFKTAQTLKHTKFDSRQKNLLRARKLALFIAICYTVITGCLIWSLYTQGFKDIQALFNYLVATLMYYCAEVLCFVSLVNINLDFRLHT